MTKSYMHVEEAFATGLGMTVEQVMDTDLRTLVNLAYERGIDLDVKMGDGTRAPGLHCIVIKDDVPVKEP